MTEKGKRKYYIVGKTIAFILLLISLISVSVGICGVYIMIQEGFYLVDGEDLKNSIVSEYTSEIGKEILYSYNNGGVTYANRCASTYQCQYVIKKNGTIMLGNVTGDKSVLWSGVFSYGQYEAGRYVFDGIGEYEITIYLLKRMVPDDISWICFIADNSDVLRVVFPVMTILGVVIFIGSFVSLLCLAGGRNEENEPTAGMFGRIPTDVFILVLLLLGMGWYYLITWFVSLHSVVGIIGISLGFFLLFLVWSMSIAARRRAGILWSNMLVWKLWRILKKLSGVLLTMVGKIPLIWKTVCGLVFLTLLEFLAIQIIYSVVASYTLLVVLWGVEKLVLIPVICIVALHLKALQTAGYELAEGNLDYQVNTEELFWDLKEHGENLNRISEGVNKAVKERMKSEHFKTELITNVSHDIKTPLTSIINYSDLLCKEETDNDKIKEYSDVLYRQSTRLKKLIEDLVEASKASTGSIEVSLEKCEVGVLLEQALGEFEQRLYEKNMDVITKLPEKPVKIMADGKHLWRVFDNLLNNICKYGQSGTRVYLTVEEVQDHAVITFKNISEYPLDISTEELMERFVRGDKSRHTEGNGLGLNIAKSLTELQNGTMELVIDGDLFKVILAFTTVE